jgi:hypothetical protein
MTENEQRKRLKKLAAAGCEIVTEGGSIAIVGAKPDPKELEQRRIEAILRNGELTRAEEQL